MASSLDIVNVSVSFSKQTAKQSYFSQTRATLNIGTRACEAPAYGASRLPKTSENDCFAAILQKIQRSYHYSALPVLVLVFPINNKTRLNLSSFII